MDLIGFLPQILPKMVVAYEHFLRDMTVNRLKQALK